MSSESLQTTHLAPEHIDTLTGYANRDWLNENLPEIIETNPGECAVLFVDLDGLKSKNDTEGHEAGNRLIIETADAIDGSIRHTNDKRVGDQVGRLVRLHGDELVVVLLGVKGDEDLSVVSSRVQRKLEEKRIRASIGGAIHDKTRKETASELLHRADIAMLEEKQVRKQARFDALPVRKRIASKLGSRLMRYAGINPPRQ